MGLFSFLFRRAPRREVPPPEIAARVTITIPSMDDYRFIAVDVETANDWVGSICQIGLATVDRDNQINRYSILIDPKQKFLIFNTNLHGIGPAQVRGQPSFATVFQHIGELLRSYPIVQHSTFDQRAINAACEISGIAIPQIRWIDSVGIARNAWPELLGKQGHGLASLKKVLGLEFTHHDAAEDAKAAAMIVLAAERKTGKAFTALQNSRRTGPRSAIKAAAAAQDGPLFGQIAVFTGNLSIDRNTAISLAARQGIEVKGSISRKVTLLIVGDMEVERSNGPSVKHEQALALRSAGHSIRIISEPEFMTLVGKGTLD